MNIIKKTAIAFLLSVSFSAVAPMAVAADPVVSSENVLASVISHIEQGLAEVQKSDFSAAYLHLKAAREGSAQIQGHDAVVKQGLESVIQGQIQTKTGDVEKATAELKKALGFYKSI